MDANHPTTPTVASPFKTPTVTATASNRLRRVGFELEFTGLTLKQTSAVVEEVFAVQRQQESLAAVTVNVPELGDFQIELDWQYLKKRATLEGDDPTQWLHMLSQAATLLVPVEIVCPPLPITELARLDPLIAALRQSGAQGTEDSLMAAYGVHINAESPDLEPATLFAFLRSFGLLQWWLVDTHQVDLARRISPFVDLYPEAYLKRLFSLQSPDREELLRDYLQYNASRNRALDLLPLFAEIDSQAVHRAVADDKVRPRPAFHYRLPNCQIDKPGWSLTEGWNSWWVVEELAQQRAALDQLAAQFLDMDRVLLGVSRSAWTSYLDQWLHDHALA